MEKIVIKIAQQIKVYLIKKNAGKIAKKNQVIKTGINAKEYFEKKRDYAGGKNGPVRLD